MELGELFCLEPVEPIVYESGGSNGLLAKFKNVSYRDGRSIFLSFK